ncbi:MLO-like protein 1 [Dorcoceras hygrometricum]|uniref:MLO-like protein 1 n=1 Tax=Dorcoceras hygrometricum TaxID=472368 RepID=A0A2Z7D5D1_9LAMI|nr:MLO-like protein 1 [Dorcoceras hygrometricum]
MFDWYSQTKICTCLREELTVGVLKLRRKTPENTATHQKLEADGKLKGKRQLISGKGERIEIQLGRGEQNEMILLVRKEGRTLDFYFSKRSGGELISATNP